MSNNMIAPHEAIEVRAFIGQELLGVKKISASLPMVKDAELKSFMQDSLNSKKTALQEIRTAIGPQLGM